MPLSPQLPHELSIDGYSEQAHHLIWVASQISLVMEPEHPPDFHERTMRLRSVVQAETHTEEDWSKLKKCMDSTFDGLDYKEDPLFFSKSFRRVFQNFLQEPGEDLIDPCQPEEWVFHTWMSIY